MIPDNRTILYSQQFIDAITTGDMKTVLDFFKYNPQAWKWRESREGTPDYSTVHWAVEGRQPEMVELLIKKGADIHIGAKGEMTPLMLAARSGDIESVALLLEAGAKANAKDARGKTALDYARKRETGAEKRQIMEWLEQAIADPDAGRKPKSRTLITFLANIQQVVAKGAKRPVTVEKAVFRKKSRPALKSG